MYYLPQQLSFVSGTYRIEQLLLTVLTYTSEDNAFCIGQALPQVKQRQLCKWSPLAVSNNDNSQEFQAYLSLCVCQTAGSHYDCRLLVFRTARELRWH